jgi:hypothetical protein
VSLDRHTDTSCSRQRILQTGRLVPRQSGWFSLILIVALQRLVSRYVNYLVNERVARQLECEFGHPPVRGRHNVAVARFADADGLPELCEWIRAYGLLDGPSPPQAVSDAERHAAVRRGRDPFELSTPRPSRWKRRMISPCGGPRRGLQAGDPRARLLHSPRHYVPGSRQPRRTPFRRGGPQAATCPRRPRIDGRYRPLVTEPNKNGSPRKDTAVFGVR